MVFFCALWYNDVGDFMDPFIHARNNNLNFFYQNPIHLDMVDDLGQSLLFYAIRGNATEMCYYLIENHINLISLVKKVKQRYLKRLEKEKSIWL